MVSRAPTTDAEMAEFWSKKVCSIKGMHTISGQYHYFWMNLQKIDQKNWAVKFRVFPVKFHWIWPPFVFEILFKIQILIEVQNLVSRCERLKIMKKTQNESQNIKLKKGPSRLNQKFMYQTVLKCAEIIEHFWQKWGRQILKSKWSLNEVPNKPKRENPFKNRELWWWQTRGYWIFPWFAEKHPETW